ncbi:mitomycin antibiotic biosynthesis protein [Scytonema hofmannii PCC 7110]|uniref:Mitomycin antibiotic biosynthesis protein n=1 Tax=Scytonema hofmannii PCC 7110 TaxID=128403 RepID=A0A139XHV0_9CYAN|nr:phytanoyl-CoA dioxygenase family protein [Scytonema hofmannii]KYC41820.1 mitomycin antibiotic biosynthesis protein [Scytonema hofmannii PCC 7110]KYC44266.1 mitomycin antibiotic biosynthesis protein [Scytonema hofmannii PCC 7110]
MLLRQDRLSILGNVELSSFQDSGFLVIENLLESTMVKALRDRFEPLFRGEFETGVYPDEWYWREGMSLPDITRHMANAWKSDLTIAKLVLSADIARAAALLMSWNGARLGQDTIWMKPPQTKAIAMHQDSSYMDFLVPSETITCWITLDDTQANAGTIEYVPGSHNWKLTARPLDFHTPKGGYQAKMLAAAALAGIENPQIIPIEVPAGSCVFHHGHIWHGSGANTTEHIIRRSIGIHLLRSDVRFHTSGGGYIYGRYQRVGDTSLDESFFPVLWVRNGYRTPYLDHYCRLGL